MSRNLRCLVPNSTSVLKPNVVSPEKEIEKMSKRQLRVKHYDRKAKPLPTVEVGEDVLFKHDPKAHWVPATIIQEIVPGRSFKVKTPESVVYQRSKEHLLKSNQNDHDGVSTSTESTDCKSAREIWQKLQELFEQENAVQKHSVQQRFLTYAWEAKGMAHHVSSIQSLANTLNNFGDKLSEELIQIKILMTLPSQYINFLSAWDSATDKSMKSLCERLMLEESRHEMNQPSQPSVSKDCALVSKVKCFHCGKMGHMKRDCRVRESKPEQTMELASRDQQLVTRIGSLVSQLKSSESNNLEISKIDFILSSLPLKTIPDLEAVEAELADPENFNTLVNYFKYHSAKDVLQLVRTLMKDIFSCTLLQNFSWSRI
ncbi:hypothetical protein WDU94_010718 [Cyamophila willieti]